MKTGNIIILLLSVMLLSSCYAEISDESANSASAIIAVFGEYLLAIVSLILMSLLWIIRPLAMSCIIFGILGLLSVFEVTIDPLIFLLAGGVLILVSAVHIKLYHPTVLIGVKRKQVEEQSGEQQWKGILLQLVIGVALLAIEYLFFAK